VYAVQSLSLIFVEVIRNPATEVIRKWLSRVCLDGFEAKNHVFNWIALNVLESVKVFFVTPVSRDNHLLNQIHVPITCQINTFVRERLVKQ